MKDTCWSIAVIASFILGFLYDSAISYIPRDSDTANKIRSIGREISIFYNREGRLPMSLSEVADSAKSKECKETAWGERIDYSVTNGTEVILSASHCSGDKDDSVQISFLYAFDVQKSK